MQKPLNRRLLTIAFAASALLVLAGLPAGATAASDNVYSVTNLVSDVSGQAPNTDSNLVNAWGLTSTAGSPWWVSDNGMDVSTVYRANGTTARAPVSVSSAPTGAVSNSSANFVVTNGPNSAPAAFIFATEHGQILAWAGPTVSGNTAMQEVATPDAVYKGLAIAGDRLYATDFHHGRVDVFDGSFQPVNTPGAFVDPGIPAGYAPFGIQNVDGKIVVTYAKQDADQHDDVAGQGHGFVDRFTTTGTFLGRVATHGQLNSPWGIAKAPANFGRFSGDLLVGNFGDGQISAYEPQADGSFELVGQLRTSDNKVLTIDGLWALQFGKGALANNGPTTTLFFTAGPDGESHGLFGTITTG
jgi:uncharacterized protein (TIGR03118 family)